MAAVEYTDQQPRHASMQDGPACSTCVAVPGSIQALVQTLMPPLLRGPVRQKDTKACVWCEALFLQVPEGSELRVAHVNLFSWIGPLNLDEPCPECRHLVLRQ